MTLVNRKNILNDSSKQEGHIESSEQEQILTLVNRKDILNDSSEKEGHTE